MGNSLYENLNSGKDKHLHIVAYYFKEWKGYYMDVHRHDQIEFMYVLSGDCSINTVNDTVKLKKGEFIFLDANFPHNLIVTPGKSCRMLNLEMVFQKSDSNNPTLSEVAEIVPLLKQLMNSKTPYIVLKDTGNIFPVIKNIITENDEKREGFGVLTDQLLTELFIKTARLCYLDKNQTSQQSLYTEKTIRFLHHNYDRKLNIIDIANYININPSYLQRIFKKQTGKTIVEFVLLIRIEKAKMFLSQNDLPISEIAYLTGFEDSKYFSVCFKKNTGTTPSSHRKKSKHWIE